MARKRKKSKSTSNKRARHEENAPSTDPRPDEAATDEGVPDADDEHTDVIDLDAEVDGSSIDELLERDIPDEEEITTISLDDELDADADTLIAQALALDGLDASPEPEAGTESREEEGGADAPSDPPVESAAPDESESPVITPAALAALRALRNEGVGSVPDELVLDLGEGGTPEDRDRLLQAALAHVEMQDAVYRVPSATGSRGRSSAAATAAVLVAALWVAVAPPGFLVPPPPPTVDAPTRLEGARTALWLQAQQVEAFRVENGRLPASTEELPIGFDGIEYVRSNSRLYQLVARDPDGRAILYDSASPDAVFESIAERFAHVGGGPS